MGMLDFVDEAADTISDWADEASDVNYELSYTTDPETHYERTIVKNFENREVTFEVLSMEESRGLFDDPDEKKLTETIHLRKDINRITNIFQEAYTDRETSAGPEVGYLDPLEENDIVDDKANKLFKLAKATSGINKNIAKRKINQGRQQFKDYWLNNVLTQHRRRQRNAKVDGLNTTTGLDKQLSAETKAHQPMGTPKINGERLGSTPETEADNIKLGS